MTGAAEAATSARAEASRWKAQADDFKKDLDESIDTSKTLVWAVDQKDAEINALSEAVATFCHTFGFEDIPSGSSPWSHTLALSGHMRSELREALHTGVKWALAVVSSHYEVDIERVSEGYVLPKGDDAAEAEVQRLADAAEGPGAALALHFDEEVVPPVSPPDAGSYSVATPSSDAEDASAVVRDADPEDAASLPPGG